MNKPEAGDRITPPHCEGYETEVLYTIDFADGSWSATCRCHNPFCPDVCGCGNSGCRYDGVVTFESEEMEVATS